MQGRLAWKVGRMGWKAEGARSIIATGRLICRLRSMSLRMLLAMASSVPLHPLLGFEA